VLQRALYPFAGGRRNEEGTIELTIHNKDLQHLNVDNDEALK
jgi:hypothetical protein